MKSIPGALVERIDAGIRQTFALLIPLAVVFGIHETAQLEVIEKSLFAMVAAGVPAYFAASIVAHAIIAKLRGEDRRCHIPHG